MMSFAVAIILSVITFSFVIICFNIVVHVSLMFCCKFALSSMYGFGFVLFCFWSFSIL